MANKIILTDILEKCIFVYGKLSLLHKDNTHYYNCELFPLWWGLKRLHHNLDSM